jgi:hypothetical protein
MTLAQPLANGLPSGAVLEGKGCSISTIYGFAFREKYFYFLYLFLPYDFQALPQLCHLLAMSYFLPVLLIKFEL